MMWNGLDPWLVDAARKRDTARRYLGGDRKLLKRGDWLRPWGRIRSTWHKYVTNQQNTSEICLVPERKLPRVIIRITPKSAILTTELVRFYS
jgi:hypothetical protein